MCRMQVASIENCANFRLNCLPAVVPCACHPGCVDAHCRAGVIFEYPSIRYELWAQRNVDVIHQLGIPMKNIWFALLLLSSASGAAWTRVDTGEEFDAYVDLATLRRHGDVVHVFILLDYKDAQQWSDMVYWSLTANKEYECAKGQHRTPNRYFHAEQMGQPESNYSVRGGMTWSALSRDSVEEVFFQIACKN